MDFTSIKSKVVSSIDFLLPIFLLLTVVAFALARLDTQSWLCFLLAQAQLQNAAFAFAIMAASLARRNWRSAALACTVLALTWMRIATPGLDPPTNPTTGGHEIKVCTLNACEKNDNLDSIVSFLRSTEPALLFVQEMTPELAQKIDRTLPACNQRFILFDQSGKGAAIFTSATMTKKRVLAIAPESKALYARLEFRNGAPLNVILIHLCAPTSEAKWQLQNQQLQGLGNQLTNLPRPILIAGDMNSASWTSQFKSLTESQKLSEKHSMGFPSPTWPSSRPMVRSQGKYHRINIPVINRLASLPIDHVLASPEIAVVSSRTGPFTGSDHFPLIVEIELKND